MSDIPKIAEAEVLRFAGNASVAKGRSYARNGDVIRGKREGRTLRARCKGSRSTPYDVWATFDATGVAAAGCSCPAFAEWGGYCKHVAALLLTWIDRPGDFSDVSDAVSPLDELSREQLIAIISQCINIHPDLEDIVTLAASVKAGTTATIDVAAWQHMTEAAFAHDDGSWGFEGRVAGRLQPIVQSAKELLVAGQIVAALTAFDGIVRGVIGRGDWWSFSDRRYHLEGVLAEIAEQLNEILGITLIDRATRGIAIGLLWDLHDVASGYDWGEAPWEGLVELTTAEERAGLAERAREVISALPQRDHDYERRQWEQFLMDLESDLLSDDELLDRLRGIGRHDAVIERLLELGRSEEIVGELHHLPTYQLRNLQPRLVSLSSGDAAEHILLERAQAGDDGQAVAWLRERLEACGDDVALLEMDIAGFRKWPSIDGYRKLRARAERVDRWVAVREDVLAQLAKSRANHLLIDIALDEGDIDRAIALLDSPASSLFGYAHDVRLRVAMAAEETRWEYAVGHYKKCASDFIERKNSSAYRAACEFLIRVRRLYEVNGQADVWEAYIGELRASRPTLKALMRELDALGLAPGL